MTRLLLVRHGESEAMVNQVVGGPVGCTGLSPLGNRQALALADRLRREGIDADVVLTSTLPRAQETGAIVASALSLPVEEDEDLCELRPGECDGMSWADWRQRFLFDMSSEPDVPLSPGGESHNQFASRVYEVMQRIASQYGDQTVIAACHGGVVQAAFAVLTGVPLFQLASSPHPTSITEWRHNHDGWRLVRYNDAAHLSLRQHSPAK